MDRQDPFHTAWSHEITPPSFRGGDLKMAGFYNREISCLMKPGPA